MVTRIALIRHASTDTGGRLCGSWDVPLSPTGLRQLQALVHRLRAQAAPAALVTSTLRRAREVAAALGRVWELEPQPAEWAREIHCGDVEGIPLTQLQRDLPEYWNRNEAQTDETFAWPGGESYAQFRRRILDGLQVTAAAHSGQRVVIVTHAGVIAQVMGVISKRPASVWSADRPDPLTATEVIWNNDGPSTVLTYNAPDWR